jgi:hypothetical protein
MQLGDVIWARDTSPDGAEVWVNLSIARVIRRDEGQRVTVIEFDQEHLMHVTDAVDGLLADATLPQAGP